MMSAAILSEAKDPRVENRDPSFHSGRRIKRRFERAAVLRDQIAVLKNSRKK